MLKKDLSLRNPLRLIGHDNEDIIDSGGFGAVLARTGVGKTAFMVQLALNSLIRNNNVLHISLNEPVDKVSLWYKEVFHLLSKQYNPMQVKQLWEMILPFRLIMTFKVDGFSASKLEERLTDLITQNIFIPQMVIIDGLPFDQSSKQTLADLRKLAVKHKMHIWFTITTHRHQAPDKNGLPAQLSNIADLFEVAIQLLPQAGEIHVKALKGGPSAKNQKPPLLLDPATMLIKNPQPK